MTARRLSLAVGAGISRDDNIKGRLSLALRRSVVGVASTRIVVGRAIRVAVVVRAIAVILALARVCMKNLKVKV